jgi:AraC-like DNA-binding protein
MMESASERRIQRMQAAREELVERIARALPRDGTVEPQRGMHFRRHSEPGERVYDVYPAAFCVIAQGSRMRHLAKFRGQAHRMVRAVEKLRKNFDKPLRVEDLAHELGMSVSGFHAYFKKVTAMSPLQFQKQLRLQEARRLMLTDRLNAAEAGYRVGYDDASHFSREYKRHFGEPPMRDVEALRGTSAGHEPVRA